MTNLSSAFKNNQTLTLLLGIFGVIAYALFIANYILAGILLTVLMISLILPCKAISKDEITLRDRVREVARITGLDGLGAMKKRFEDMSLGMKARLGLARALLKNPPVLILDEPTLGLDPASARHIRGLLKELARKEKKTVLLTTHNMFEAELICDRVAIIDKGVIIAEGEPSELKERVRKKSSIVVTFRGEIALGEKLLDYTLRELGYPARTSTDKDKITIRIVSDRGEEENTITKIVGKAVEIGLKLVEARIERPSLEDVFIELTSR